MSLAEQLLGINWKCPFWQRSQPISCKAKFPQRDSMYVVDFKYNIHYQNIWGGLRSYLFLCPEKPKMPRNLPNNLHGWAFYKIMTFDQESLPITYYNFHHKSLVRPTTKSPNWQRSQPISYKANLSQRETAPTRCQIQYNLPK